MDEDDEAQRINSKTGPNTSVELPLPENLSRMVENFALKAGSSDHPLSDTLQQQSKMETGTLEPDELDQQNQFFKS